LWIFGYFKVYLLYKKKTLKTLQQEAAALKKVHKNKNEEIV
jgi:hypothetical protein